MSSTEPKLWLKSTAIRRGGVAISADAGNFEIWPQACETVGAAERHPFHSACPAGSQTPMLSGFVRPLPHFRKP